MQSLINRIYAILVQYLHVVLIFCFLTSISQDTNHVAKHKIGIELSIGMSPKPYDNFYKNNPMFGLNINYSRFLFKNKYSFNFYFGANLRQESYRHDYGVNGSLPGTMTLQPGYNLSYDKLIITNLSASFRKLFYLQKNWRFVPFIEIGPQLSYLTYGSSKIKSYKNSFNDPKIDTLISSWRGSGFYFSKEFPFFNDFFRLSPFLKVGSIIKCEKIQFTISYSLILFSYYYTGHSVQNYYQLLDFGIQF